MMKFPEKLWLIVNKCSSGAISWGNEGKTIIIDYPKFENEFLGENSTIFKTRNIISFIRQLNLYGFRKCSRSLDVHEFKNPYFIRGEINLLRLMKRKFRYTVDVESSAMKAVKEEPNGKNFNDKDNSVPKSLRLLQKINSLPGSSKVQNHFGPMQDIMNPLYSSSWLRKNAYDPLNFMYPTLYPMRNDAYAALNIKQEIPDATEGKAESPHWGNLGMYGNVFFVPVPAQYGMYPGFFNSNLPIPTMPHSDEIKNQNTEK